MRPMRTSLSKAASAFFMLIAAPASAQRTALFEDEAKSPWQEVEMPFPAYPTDASLIPLQVGPTATARFFMLRMLPQARAHYQMLAAGFVGLFAGLLPPASGRAEIWLLAGYGIVSAFAYGWVMDFAFWPFGVGNDTGISFDPALGPLQNLHRFVLYNIATSMGWNLGRALTNAVLIVLVGPALLRLLRRSARPAEFTPGFEPSQQGPERTE